MTRHVFFAGFALTLSAALAYYVNSSFLESLVGKNRLGLIYALGATLAILFIFLVPRLGRRYGLLKPIRWFGLIFFAGIITLAVSQTKLIQLLAFVITYASVVCLGLWLDLYLETISADKKTGRIRGGYLTAVNAAVLISPLISGNLLNQTTDYGIIYLLSALVALPFLYQIFFRLTDQRLPPLVISLNQKLHDRNLRKILALDFLLNLFYFFMVIYLPLHLIETLGFSWGNIGFIFTIMLLPFVLIEYPLGWLADLKFGEKEILTAGLIITALFTLLIPFLTTTSLTVWAMILFGTRVGASAVEAMKETYLFKKVSASDVSVISLSRFMVPMAYLVGSLVAVLFLKTLAFPITYLFILISVFFLLGLYFSLTLKDTR